MKKQLIQAQNVERFITAENTILVDNTMVLTPGARDLLSSRKVDIIRVAQVQAEENSFSLSACLPPKNEFKGSGSGAERDAFTRNLSAMLEKSYGLTNPVELDEYTQKAIELIKENL